MNMPAKAIKAKTEEEQALINEGLEQGNNENFKDFARTLTPEERKIVLKATKTQELLDELQRRFNSLERRDRGVRELFNIPDEDFLTEG